MTDETRTELRRGIELILRSISAGYGVKSGRPVYMLSGGYAHNLYTGRIPNGIECHNFPPLTTAQQLALSVLIGDESVLPQALADYLLDQGHEYATAVAERATMAERVRCVKLMSPVLNDRLFDKTAFEAREAMRYPNGEYDQAFCDAWHATSDPDSSPPSPPARPTT